MHIRLNLTDVHQFLRAASVRSHVAKRRFKNGRTTSITFVALCLKDFSRSDARRETFSAQVGSVSLSQSVDHMSFDMVGQVVHL